MIKQLIGTLALLASLAVFVCTALHRDRYSSLLFDSEQTETPAGEPAEPAAEPAEPAEPAGPTAEPVKPAGESAGEPAVEAPAETPAETALPTDEPTPATGEEASDAE